MSYRSFKYLLGETSLERKCRFIFGLGILLLVSGSFFWYGQKTESLVRKQTTQTARMLVNPALLNIHYKSLGSTNFATILDTLSSDLRPLDDLTVQEARVLTPHDTRDSTNQPRDDFERSTLARFIQTTKAEASDRKTDHSSNKARLFVDGSPTWSDRITRGKKRVSVHAGRLLPAKLLDVLPHST